MSDGLFKTQLRRLMPRAVRPHRILSGRLRGRWIVTSWHDYPAAILGRTERALLDWFEGHVKPGQTWLDVGAHYGYTAIALSRLVGPRGRVFAFEPMLATAGHLARTRALNDVRQLTVIPCGLGAPEYVSLMRLATVRGMVDGTVAGDGAAVETFLVARLDWLWPLICAGDRRIHGVKVDVQGMEVEALRGMMALVQEFLPELVIEVHAGVDRGELSELLEGVRYSTEGACVESGPAGASSSYLDDHSYHFSPRV